MACVDWSPSRALGLPGSMYRQTISWPGIWKYRNWPISSGPRRVAGETDAMRLAPIGNLAIERLLQPRLQGPVVVATMLGGVRLVVIPQSRQMLREVIAEKCVDVLEDAGRPRHHAPLAPPGQHRRLVREDRFHRLAEVLAELVIVSLVHQPDEAGDGFRIQDVPSRRLILRHFLVIGPARRIVLREMQAPDDRVAVPGRAVDDREAMVVGLAPDGRHKILARRQFRLAVAANSHALHLGPRLGLVEIDAHQPARAKGRVLRRHLPAR